MSGASQRKLRVGFLVNPVAGLGGRAGLKGTDDPARLPDLVQGLEWGEEVHAFHRGAACVRRLDRARMVLVTPPTVLGEDVVKWGTRLGGPVFEIVRLAPPPPQWGSTTREDTQRYVDRLLQAHIDVLMFVGGDGTAADVAHAASQRLPILGIPAGVKMFSPVFAETPEVAALVANGLAAGFGTRDVDVIDLDESSYRSGAWIVRRHAVARVPEGEGVQAGKGGAIASDEEAKSDLVAWFRDHRRTGVTYILGAGATVAAIKQDLGGGTPLGVDAWRDGAWLAVDADEQTLLAALGEEGPAEVVVSPTGSQGAILGRGTAQISVPVLERVGVGNVRIIATPQKLLGLPALFVDTGDPELDHQFPDYVKVRTDPMTEKVFPVRKGAPLGRR
jgi:predicted polyphosphate/ATP-dependent NAD kinase